MAPMMIFELGFQKRSQIRHALGLGFFDILHSPKDVFIGLFIFCLLRSELFLNPEILPLGLLHLR